MSKRRKNYSPQEKASILREHLINKVPVSDLCDQHGIHPTLFYKWQKVMFEGMNSLFEPKQDVDASKHRKQIETLKEKLANKDMVIAQIMEDYVAVKKSLGEI
ncbi:MAG: transposase [Magnetococcus sp. DMHC-1]|nr:transposase [Magnetococcales bacterium]